MIAACQITNNHEESWKVSDRAVKGVRGVYVCVCVCVCVGRRVDVV